MEKVLNYIGGELVPPSSQVWFDKPDPATGEPSVRVPDSDEADVQRAVEAARSAFPSWAATPASERARLLRRIADAIRTRAEAFARAESIDTGKPLKVAATVDIPRSILNFEFFADAVTQFSSEAHLTDGVALNYTLRSPLGVVGCISPWNLPLYLLTWKIAPALAIGNCVVAKPSEVTPMTAYLLAQVCREAGLPPGVLNIVHGFGPKVGAPMSRHPDISAISFTGSTRTGAEIARTAAPLFKKLSLEMGGKNPNVIFADCDFDEALATTVRSSFSNQGQICLCGSRIFVQAPIYERFKEALVDAHAGAEGGRPAGARAPTRARWCRRSTSRRCWATSSWPARRAAASSPAAGARRCRGAAATAGSWSPRSSRAWATRAAPTRRRSSARWPRSRPSRQEEEVLAWANGTRYGLAASVWTRDLSRAHRVAGEAAERHRLGELLDAARPAHAVRRGEGLGRGARGRLGRAALLHRAQERVRQLARTL